MTETHVSWKGLHRRCSVISRIRGLSRHVWKEICRARVLQPSHEVWQRNSSDECNSDHCDVLNGFFPHATSIVDSYTIARASQLASSCWDQQNSFHVYTPKQI